VRNTPYFRSDFSLCRAAVPPPAAPHSGGRGTGPDARSASGSLLVPDGVLPARWRDRVESFERWLSPRSSSPTRITIASNVNGKRLISMSMRGGPPGLGVNEPIRAVEVRQPHKDENTSCGQTCASMAQCRPRWCGASSRHCSGPHSLMSSANTVVTLRPSSRKQFVRHEVIRCEAANEKGGSRKGKSPTRHEQTLSRSPSWGHAPPLASSPWVSSWR